MPLVLRAEPGKQVRLTDISPDDANGVSRDDTDRQSAEIQAKLTRLQESLYAPDRIAC
jgi:hypothetical protein